MGLILMCVRALAVDRSAAGAPSSRTDDARGPVSGIDPGPERRAALRGATFCTPYAVLERIMSTERIPKIPGPHHPITLEPTTGRVIVRLAGRTIADTHKAIAMRESNYRPVQYVPRSDVDMSFLERTSHATY